MRLCLVVVLHLFMVFLFVGNEMLDGQYSKCLNHVGIRHDRNLVEDVIFVFVFHLAISDFGDENVQSSDLIP